jgi:hypothetical protein
VPVKSGLFQAKLHTAMAFAALCVACLQQSVLRRAHNEGKPATTDTASDRLCESGWLF